MRPSSGCSAARARARAALVNAIAGVTTPRRGHVRVDGVTLFDSAQRIDLSPQERRVGYVFQDALLFPHLRSKRICCTAIACARRRSASSSRAT